jgi:hypothetical protein
MTRSSDARAAGVLLLAALSACEPEREPVPPDWPFAPEPAQWKLPDRLDEISGIASDGGTRLFAHDDERAVVYEIDATGGAFVKSFALGDGSVRADFEDLAVAGEDFYLLTSTGVLYRFQEGDDGTAVNYETLDTGLGGRCELEGLAWDVTRKRLWLACKTPLDPALAGQIAVFAWDPAVGQIDEALSWRVAQTDLAGRIGKKRFDPSAIALTADGGFLLLAGRQRALAALAPDATIAGVWRLDTARHVQPEGLALLPTGELLIADEGKDRRARLAIYRRR